MRIKRIIISILLLLVTISCGNKKAISKPDLDNPEGIIKQLEVLLDESNPNEEEIVSLMVDLMSQPDPAKKHLAMNYLHKIYRFDIMNGNKYWINRALEDPNACSKLINEITENWAIWESRGEIDELYFASRTLTTQSCLDISDWLWERIADPTDEHIGFYIDQTWLCNRLSPEKVDLLVTAIADKNHKKFSRRRLFNFITYFAIDKLENDHWIKLLSVLEDNILPEKEALLFIEKRLDHASPIPGQRIGELVVNKNIPNNVRYALIQRYGEKIPEEAFLLIVDNKHDNDEMRLHALRLLPTNSSQKLFLEILMNDSESEALRLYALDNLDASWNQNLEKKCESFCQADIGSKLCAHALFLANRKNSVKFNAITAEAVERVVRTANEPAFLLDFYSGVVNPRVFRLLSHDTQLYLNAVDQLYICDGVLWLTFNKKILRIDRNQINNGWRNSNCSRIHKGKCEKGNE